jgi:hypothetical protein
MDVTDTSNQKVRFTVNFQDSSNGVIIGGDTSNGTHVSFTKLKYT